MLATVLSVVLINVAFYLTKLYDAYALVKMGQVTFLIIT